MHGSKMCIVERLLYEFFEERWDEFHRVHYNYLPIFLSIYGIWGEQS